MHRKLSMTRVKLKFVVLLRIFCIIAVGCSIMWCDCQGGAYEYGIMVTRYEVQRPSSPREQQGVIYLYPHLEQ